MSAEHWPGDCGDVAVALASAICPGCYAEWCLTAIASALMLPLEPFQGVDLHAPEWRAQFLHPTSLSVPAQVPA